MVIQWLKNFLFLLFYLHAPLFFLEGDLMYLQTQIYSLLSFLIILTCFTPFFIYWKYGREPKVEYSAEYERDTPTNDPPAIVNAICKTGFSKKIGEPDIDGFKATILDLINRKYINIINASATDKYVKSNSMILKINYSKNYNELNEFEIFAYRFLKAYEKNGVISLYDIADTSNYRESARIEGAYLNWKGTIKTQILNDEKLKEVFLKKGDLEIKKFGKIGLLSVLIIIWSFFNLPTSQDILISSTLLLITSLASLKLPQKIGGQWTTYGEEYNAHWQNFRRYIHDFSLIKEYPPESVKIWNKYIVYAAALGEAKTVSKYMQIYLPTEQLGNIEMYRFYNHESYGLFSSSLNVALNLSNNPIL